MLSSGILHGAITQKMAIFILIAVRTSNPISNKFGHGIVNSDWWFQGVALHGKRNVDIQYVSSRIVQLVFGRSYEFRPGYRLS